MFYRDLASYKISRANDIPLDSDKVDSSLANKDSGKRNGVSPFLSTTTT